MITLKAIDSSYWHDGEMNFAAVDDSRDDNDAVVGILNLYAYDPINRRCAVGITVRQDLRGKGYGKQMLSALTLMATFILHLHQLYADIETSNTASLTIFERSNFSRCALMREWVSKDDGYQDIIRVQKILNHKKKKKQQD